LSVTKLDVELLPLLIIAALWHADSSLNLAESWIFVLKIVLNEKLKSVDDHIDNLTILIIVICFSLVAAASDRRQYVHHSIDTSHASAICHSRTLYRQRSAPHRN
jgi:hypothetical protein